MVGISGKRLNQWVQLSMLIGKPGTTGADRGDMSTSTEIKQEAALVMAKDLRSGDVIDFCGMTRKVVSIELEAIADGTPECRINYLDTKGTHNFFWRPADDLMRHIGYDFAN